MALGTLGVILASAAAPEGQAVPAGLGPPPLYTALVEGELEPAGRIQNQRVTIDRFEFELTNGDLYLLAPLEGNPAIAVFLGDGVVRSYPPDGVEHQQLERFLDDDDFLEEPFDRFLFWFTDDTGLRLRALADDFQGRNADDAQDLLDDRREELLEHQLWNPDARVLADLLTPAGAAPTHATRPFFYAQIDSDDHGWISVEIEPLNREEVQLVRFDRGRKVADYWMGFHALSDFSDQVRGAAFDGFPRDPGVVGKLDEGDDGDDDDWHARDLGLSPRPLAPEHEGWTRRATVSRTDVDLALKGNGDAKASAALVVEPRVPLTSLRLRLSPVMEVTDVRWHSAVPANPEDVRNVTLLTGGSDEPDEPVALSGEPLHYARATHERRFNDDLHEPWVTIALPRVFGPGETFVIELAYEGELIEDLRDGRTYVLKDVLNWMPNHAHNRGTPGTRTSVTYRVPERFRVASGSTLVDERVVDDTRIMRWVSDEPVSSMSFNLGRFDVTYVETEGPPRITVYGDRTHRGFAPGNKDKTIADLTGAIEIFSDYFGPYPFDSLLLTETRTYNGLAFPGLVLLSFQAFGELHTGEAEFFRAHEVAHQWWGIGVEFKDYRDQWLSEGFAQYSAALYALSGMQKEDQFLEMLDAWQLDVLGEVNIGQGLGRHYGFRPEVMRRSDGHESGPLVVGYRLRSGDTPFDYRLLVYEKGAFVLHMLRMMLTDLDTGDDTRFRDLMRGFVADHRVEAASTDAFEAAVTRTFGEPMDWFFDQWVYGVDVPTYRPDLTVSPLIDQDNPFVLHGTIRQEDVPDGFRMPVPIRILFDDRPSITHRVWVDADTVDVEIRLPAEPSEIEFNYHHGVLADVR
jgi:hypothetical protein